MYQPVLFSASRPTDNDPPGTGLPAAPVKAAPAAVGTPPPAVVLVLLLLSPSQAAVTEMSTTPTATAFHTSERRKDKVSPNEAAPRRTSNVTTVTPRLRTVGDSLTDGQRSRCFRNRVAKRPLQSGDDLEAARRSGPPGAAGGAGHRRSPRSGREGRGGHRARRPA